MSPAITSSRSSRLNSTGRGYGTGTRSRARQRAARASARIWRTTLRPGMPVTPPPPCVPDPGLVQPAHRRAQVRVAGRGPGVEHLAQAQLAVEDVPPDQPVLLLHLVRPDHLAVQDRAGEPGSHRLHPGDHPVGVGGQRLVLRGVGVLMRHPLGEQRHHVLPLGRERVIEDARDADVGEGKRRRPARDRVLERGLDVIQALGQHDRPAVHLGVESRDGWRTPGACRAPD